MTADQIRQVVVEAFWAGWGMSGEGFNQEHPFGTREESAKDPYLIDALAAQMEQLEKLLSGQTDD